MAKSHTWFATKDDTPLIMAFLKGAGATLVGGEPVGLDGITDGREFAIHFPKIGPIEFWPSQIELPELGDNSPQAKRTILASIRQQQSPGIPQIDVDRSAVAGVKLPELRDDRYWVAGQIWFPTSRLQDTFPELNRICQKLERFLGKQELVYDNRKAENSSKFAYQLCMSGVVQKVTAMPEAFKLLQGGEFMLDLYASDKLYRDFRRRLQLSGHEPTE